MAQDKDKDGKRNRDRTGVILSVLHFGALCLAIVLVLRIAYIQWIYKPDPELEKYLTSSVRKELTDPVRGSIMAMDGRLLASSTPMYQIYMDCTVQKKKFSSEGRKGEIKEKEWLDKARELSAGLASIYMDRSAEEYYRLISRGRRDGRMYVKIGYQIDHGVLQKVKSLPLFNEGGFKGGIIIEKIDTRQYPYGSLARRTIGYVKDNNVTSGNNLIGLEGKYNYLLHGREGVQWLRRTDNHGWIVDYDSTVVRVTDGKDIRTTIDIDIQDIADKALRERIQDVEDVEGGCAIVMDVQTGAIRAMTNLKRDEEGNLREIYNYAIGTAGEPGSVFKLASLMTLVEEGKVRLEDKVPTFRGKWPYKDEKIPDDPYLKEWGKNEISISDALKISSNNVFRYLVRENYGDRPRHFIDKLYEYKLNERFDFDIAGLAAPDIPSPGADTRIWSGTTLESVAVGYSISETPLHILMFYNGIANNGKLMKHYLLESIEKNGKVEKRLGPTVLNGSICSKATADTLTRALKKVVTEGTGRYAFRNAACAVAGKTGTARIAFEFERNGRQIIGYQDDSGRKKHQATFVGFFPADDPQYTAIVVVYSKLSKANFYGAAYAAPVLRKIVDNVYTLDPQWGNEIKAYGHVREMEQDGIETGLDRLGEVPDMKGLGLKDALYSIENCGYRCVYSGSGHVTSQSPAPGTPLQKGGTIKLTLK